MISAADIDRRTALPVQRELGIDLPPSIPLVHVEVAKNLLATDYAGVEAHIDEGNILWAFNIATPSAETPELRIYRASLLSCYFKEYKTPGYRNYDHLAHLPEILCACLPPRKLVTHHSAPHHFALSSLARRWSCSPQHVQNLIDAGCLDTIAPARMGPNGSAQILRASAEQFLTANCESLPNNATKTLAPTQVGRRNTV